MEKVFLEGLALLVCVFLVFSMFFPGSRADESRPKETDAVTFRVSNPVNCEASSVLSSLEKLVEDVAEGHRIFAEVSLPAFIKIDPRAATKSQRQGAFNTISRKRVDFLIVDRGGKPLVAIEYHGSGHSSRGSAKRDAVKRDVMCRAGLQLIEIYPGDVPGVGSKKVIDALKQGLAA